MIFSRLIFLIIFLPVPAFAQPEPDSAELHNNKVKSMEYWWLEKGKLDTLRRYEAYEPSRFRVIAQGGVTEKNTYTGVILRTSRGDRASERFISAKKTETGIDSGAYGVVNTYDTLNRLTRQMSYELRGTNRKGWDTLSSSIHYLSYDSLWNKESEMIAFRGYEKRGKYVFKYDSLHRLIRQEYFFDGSRTETVFFRYDSRGKLVSEITYNGKNVQLSEIIYVYTDVPMSGNVYSPAASDYPPTRTKSGRLTYFFYSKEEYFLRSDEFSFLPGGIREKELTEINTYFDLKNGIWKTAKKHLEEKNGKVTDTVYHYTYQYF